MGHFGIVHASSVYSTGHSMVATKMALPAYTALVDSLKGRGIPQNFNSVSGTLARSTFQVSIRRARGRSTARDSLALARCSRRLTEILFVAQLEARNYHQQV